MNALLDSLWLQIVIAIRHGVALMDFLVAPLNTLGPIVAVTVLVMVTVALTGFLGKRFKTRRYRALKAEFEHWHGIRVQALACEDRDKGKVLARNIDQAKLNKVYYDFFFEGLMNNIVTKYLPVLVMMAYVNETYRPERLEADFGRTALFQLPFTGAEPVLIGAAAWFVFALLAAYLGRWLLSAALRHREPDVVDGEGGKRPQGKGTPIESIAGCGKAKHGPDAKTQAISKSAAQRAA